MKNLLFFFPDLHRLIGEKIIQIEPPFDLSPVRGVSKECRADSKYFVDSLKKLDFWALNRKCVAFAIQVYWKENNGIFLFLVHDATAKIPTGIFG